MRDRPCSEPLDAVAYRSVDLAIVVQMALQAVVDVIAKFPFNFPATGTLQIVAHYRVAGPVFFPPASRQRRRTYRSGIARPVSSPEALREFGPRTAIA